MPRLKMPPSFFLLFFIVLISCNTSNQVAQDAEEKVLLISVPRSNGLIKTYEENESLTSSLLAKDGRLWFGTNSEGLYRYDGRSFTQFTTAEGICSNQTTSIIEDEEGDVWVGTRDGLCRFDGQTFHNIPIPWDGNENLWGEGMNAKTVLCLMQDRQGDIWLGTWGGGAFRFNPQELEEKGLAAFTSYLAEEGRLQSDGVYKNVIQDIFEDQDGNIWLTSMTHGGVTRFDGEEFRHYLMEDGLKDDMIFSGYEDSVGNLWFGSLGNREGGLHRYDGQSFFNLNQADGLPNNNVVSIFEDKEGRLWLGSNRGNLSIYDGETFETFSTSTGKTFSGIHFTLEDGNGDIWFGGKSGQLFQYDGTTIIDHTQKGN